PLPRWLQGEAPEEEAISPLEHAKESLMLGLRLREGVDLEEVARRSGLPLPSLLQEAVSQLVQEGFLEAAGPRIRPTPKAFPLLHRVVLRLWEALDPLEAPG
ncbi:MAG: coproporphyrinogen III oxidase family protein, partial [Thermus sp.]|nr:coproporphyrinogen III oxidase family protein [Thermus sp.]